MRDCRGEEWERAGPIAYVAQELLEAPQVLADYILNPKPNSRSFCSHQATTKGVSRMQRKLQTDVGILAILINLFGCGSCAES